MIRRRLLERVQDVANDRRRPEGEEEVRASILNSLRRVLGTAQNDAAIEPEFGLPSVVGFSGLAESDEQARVVAAAIKEAIERYEPRLKSVRVQRRADAKWGTLCFDIVAELNDRDAEPGGMLKVATRVVAFSGVAVDSLDAPRDDVRGRAARHE